MPIPSPRSGETQSDFISRCMSQLADTDPDRPNDQRLAMCFSQWRGREGAETFHTDFMRVLKLFMGRYGEDDGLLNFEKFLKANNLNPALPYSKKLQLREDFQWVEPLIQKYKEDSSAKYYLIRCLTANMSMNNNDYSDYTTMKAAAPSLSYRPVNVDHFKEGQFTGLGSPGGWMPYPRTRMDFTMADDLSVEGTLRVDNQDRIFQMMLDHDPSIPEEEWIIHPSIEGRPNVGATSPQEGYHFTGIAFLRKGRKLPGDPLTEIYPLMLHEALSESIQEEFMVRMETDTEGKKMEMKEYTTPPPSQQPEIPIQCNQCGWQINRPSIEKEEITCPSCGTKGQFTDRPVTEKDPTDNFTNEEVESILSILEAIPDDAEWSLDFRNNLSRLSKADIPEAAKTRVRNLMQRILKRDNPEYEPSEEVTVAELDAKVQELFKPPHGGTALSGDPQAVSPDGVQVNLQKPVIPTVGDVSGARIGLVEANLKIAELTEKNLSLSKVIELKTAENTVLTDAKISLEEKLAEKDRLLATTDQTKAHIAEAMEKLANEEAAHKQTSASLKEERKSHLRTRTRLEERGNEITKLDEDLATVKTKNENLRAQLNEALTKRAASDQNSINETKARARIQEENAELREEVAQLTRRISNYTEKMSEEAGVKLELERRLNKATEDKAKVEEALRQVSDDKRALQRRISGLENLSRKQGNFYIDEEGNLYETYAEYRKALEEENKRS